MEFDNKNELTLMRMLKDSIRRIPLLGFILRFLNTFIHLNHLKFKIYTQENQILNLEYRLYEQEKKFEEKISILENSLKVTRTDIELMKQELERSNSIINSIDHSIATRMYYQLHSIHHRLDILESKYHTSITT